MGRPALTDEEYRRRLKEINPDLESLEPYIKSIEKLKTFCKICNNIWEATPYNLLRGCRCPVCAENERGTTLEEFLIQLEKRWHGAIEYIEGYVDLYKKCKFRCTIDNHTWWIRPYDILHRSGCRVCGRRISSEKQILPLLEMLEKVKEIHGDSILYMGGYKGTMKKCKWKCAFCGYEWEARPDHIIHDASGCPFCVTSSMEKPVLEALEKKGIHPIHNQHLEGCFYPVTNYPISPDFIIETDKGKLCIETDGRQHFEPLFSDEQKFKLQWERDRYKDKILKEKGYILIRVTSSPKWGTEKHITLKKLLELIEIGINAETGEINFELFKQYDFNRE